MTKQHNTRRMFMVTAAACAALTGCTSTAPISDTTPGDPLTRTWKEGQRPAVPDLSGPSLEGGKVSLSDYRGKLVLINAWASTCGPCRLEAPELKKIQKKYGARGLRILGLDNDGDRAAGLAFQKQYKLDYRSLHDPSGRQLLRLPRGLVNTQGIPFTIVVDRSGKVAAARMGAVTEAQLTKTIAPLL
ncbi:TlpA disulfide reductase family protein [Streptomyces coacervatus]|uniref:TlpA disulfide reductase family protein n=1 Tax=Streptomyces coacervatus TaxID=647381 RepID=A0ABP7IMG3_9ACTN|nr:TlpA disulfide reductase family protein [Streptomyces coacervatus]MDF2268771.1 TlpA disulfide reductase family protein [Streptomyces coacervatus]